MVSLLLICAQLKMKVFLRSINFMEYLEDYPDTLYPLNQIVIENIFYKTNGNPREIIKLFIRIFNEIINSSESLRNILLKYE